MTGERNRPIHGDDAHAETPHTPDDGASLAPREYTVGYAKPPKSTRFKPGRSGNPKGRRKGEPSVFEQIRALFRQKLTVTEGGKRKRLSRQEVMFRSIGNKAVGGDLKAAAFLFELMKSHKDSASSSIDPKMLNDEAQAVLADFVKQLQTGEVLSNSFEGADDDLANCDSGGGNELDKEMRRDGSASADVAIGNPDGGSTGASQTDTPPAEGSEAQVPYPTPTLPDTPFGSEIQFLGHRSPGLRSRHRRLLFPTQALRSTASRNRRRTTPRRTLRNPRTPSPAKQCRLQPPIPSHGAVRNAPLSVSGRGNLSLVVPPQPQVVAIYRPRVDCRNAQASA